MLLSQTIDRLKKILEKEGDLPVKITVGYFGGKYGGYNVNKTSDLENISVDIKISPDIHSKNKNSIIPGERKAESIRLYGWES